MAIYVEYNLLIPLTPGMSFKLLSGKRTHSDNGTKASTRLIATFCSKVVRQFKGYTSSLPVGRASGLFHRFLGMGFECASPISTHPSHWGEYLCRGKRVPDALLSVSILVDAGKADESLEFMKEWKRKFEMTLKQDFVLITHDIKNVVGRL